MGGGGRLKLSVCTKFSNQINKILLLKSKEEFNVKLVTNAILTSEGASNNYIKMCIW